MIKKIVYRHMANRLLIATALVACSQAADSQVAVKADIVYTVSGSPIRDAVVLVKDGKIERVGSAASQLFRQVTGYLQPKP